jgi:metal-responsive CopG/Arc/MetJ family transcriptional regulator
MRTVQLTLDEDLVNQVDAMVQSLKTTRSAFARQALKAALARLEEEAMERKHREGYLRKPVRQSEFQPWEGEQAWGTE